MKNLCNEANNLLLNRPSGESVMTDDEFLAGLEMVTERVLKCEDDLRIEYFTATSDFPFRAVLSHPDFSKPVDIIVDGEVADIWRCESDDAGDYSLVASIPLGSERFWTRILASAVLDELLVDCQRSATNRENKDRPLNEVPIAELIHDLLTAFDNDETEVEHDA